MFRLELDEQRKVIVVEFIGLMTLNDAERYNEEIARQLSESYRRFGRVKYLADARRGIVQPELVAAKLHGPDEMLRTPKDRLAIVVETSLAKLQSNRLANDPRARVFTSIDAANAWLDADE